MDIDKSSEDFVAVTHDLNFVLRELFERVAIQYPKAGSGRLHKTKTRLEKERMLRSDLTGIFNDVKREAFKEVKSKRTR